MMIMAIQEISPNHDYVTQLVLFGHKGGEKIKKTTENQLISW